MIICQNKNGYRYTSDSLILCDFIQEDKLRGCGLDVGCGSGILSIVLGEDSKLQIDAVDIQEVNVEITALNFSKNNLNYKAILSDFIDFKTDKKYDFIFSNPPFYSKMLAQNEHLKISRHSDFLPLEAFIIKSNQLLKDLGSLYFCYDAKKVDLIFTALAKTKLKCTKLRLVYTKPTKNASLVLIKARKNSKSDLEIKPPLLCYKNNETSEELKRIYERIKVKSIDL